MGRYSVISHRKNITQLGSLLAILLYGTGLTACTYIPELVDPNAPKDGRGYIDIFTVDPLRCSGSMKLEYHSPHKQQITQYELALKDYLDSAIRLEFPTDTHKITFTKVRGERFGKHSSEHTEVSAKIEDGHITPVKLECNSQLYEAPITVNVYSVMPGGGMTVLPYTSNYWVEEWKAHALSPMRFKRKSETDYKTLK